MIVTVSHTSYFDLNKLTSKIPIVSNEISSMLSSHSSMLIVLSFLMGAMQFYIIKSNAFIKCIIHCLAIYYIFKKNIKLL